MCACTFAWVYFEFPFLLYCAAYSSCLTFSSKDQLNTSFCFITVYVTWYQFCVSDHIFWLWTSNNKRLTIVNEEIFYAPIRKKNIYISWPRSQYFLEPKVTSSLFGLPAVCPRDKLMLTMLIQPQIRHADPRSCIYTHAPHQWPRIFSIKYTALRCSKYDIPSFQTIYFDLSSKVRQTHTRTHRAEGEREGGGALIWANEHGGGIVSLTWPGAASLGLRSAITGSVCAELCHVQLMWQPCYLLRHRVHIQQESTVWVCLRLCMCGYWVKISTAMLTLLWKAYSVSIGLIHYFSFSLTLFVSL